MVFCIIAVVVFGILGIFSASHRKLAKEAWDCVWHSVSGRKCESNFDQKMKTKLSIGLLRYNKTLGKFVFHHFNLLSWLLVVLSVVSLLGIGIGVYNWWAFGNCNGPNSSAFCVYNSLFGDAGKTPQSLKGPPNLENGIWVGNPTAPVILVEFGCFSCPYTKQAEPVVEQILSEYSGQVSLLWKPFPLPAHAFSREAAIAGVCAAQQDRFVEFKKQVFENQLLFSQEGSRVFLDIATELQLDLNAFSDCLESESARARVDQTRWEGEIIGVYGTPTFFVGNQPLVGPPSYSQLKSIIENNLNTAS